MDDRRHKAAVRRSPLISLSGRVVFGVCATAIVIMCLTAGNYVQGTAAQLKSTYQTFNDLRLRNGYVAISDVQRLVLILQKAGVAGEMTPELEGKFEAAADFLFVRINNFHRVLENESNVDTTREVIAELEKLLDLADATIASDFSELKDTSTMLGLAAQAAGRVLVAYLDEVRHMQDEQLAQQSAAVDKQLTFLRVTLIVLMLLGVVSLFLLRRDRDARQAQEEAEARVRHLAFNDPLTGLPNRVHFQDRLGAMLDVPDPSVALLLVDLDGFKAINDTYGHAAGDAVLRHVAVILQDAVRPHGGIAARLGGDEFAVLLQMPDESPLECLCADIIEMIARPLQFEREMLQVNASIGLAMDADIRSGISLDTDSLTRAADFALYASKSAGKGQCTVYDEVLEQQFLRRQAMVNEMPRAINDGNMEFYLQPKVNLATGSTYGFEALVRWHRNGVIVSPEDFISTAEESGVIMDIDRFVLCAASRVMTQFNKEHGTDLSVSVNFSTVHFNSPKLINVVNDALVASGLPPELLTIEITETVEMQDWTQAGDIISEIHQLGARISIDDFGAGFSSLAYLRTTVADEIKIDRSLVEEIETSDTSRFLLDAVLDIARNLELDVVVEGVETQRQVDIVRGLGATSIQGFFYGEPVPANVALARALTEHTPTEHRSAS